MPIHHSILGIFGAGGFAREIMPLARETAPAGTKVCFVEERPERRELNGLPLLSEREFFSNEASTRYFNIAIGDSRVRQKVASACLAAGARPFTLRASNSMIFDCNDIGDGAIICAYSTITSNAQIGSFFHSNIYSYVAHDCVIGSFVTFAPRVCCNGNVHIHDHAYLGTGAVIKQGTAARPLVIGAGAIVGMGAVVTRDVPAGATVVGNPAKPMAR